MPSSKELAEELSNAVKANVPLVLLESYEWERVEGLIASVTRATDSVYLKITAERGLLMYDHARRRWTTDDPMMADQHDWSVDNVIRWVRDEVPQETRVVLHVDDFHHNFQGGEMQNGDHTDNQNTASWTIVGFWRELARMKPSRGKTVVLTGSEQHAFKDLEKEVLSLKLDLPEVADLRHIHTRVVRNHGFTEADEATTAFTLAGLKNGNVLDEDAIPAIIGQKRALLRNAGGLLDYFEPNVSMDDIGGLANLKAWLDDRRGALTPEAREFGIAAPKGLMMLGVPGCGKSLTAKAIASMWGYPLVRFDLSKVFGSYVGQTESQMRRALEVAEAVAPCILWIDEIEKGMAGAGGSGDTDSGVTARTFGILLTWMQEKTAPVFVVATSNRVQNLPAEAIRKGRFDEIFFVDLPGAEVREEILRKKVASLGAASGSSPEDLDLTSISDHTKLFSGAELEQLVKDALFAAFRDGARPLLTDDLLEVANRTYPLAITMREDISALRQFAHNRAQPADGAEITKGVADIEPEENPFVDDGSSENPFEV